jgi:hypothetical protein
LYALLMLVLENYFLKKYGEFFCVIIWVYVIQAPHLRKTSTLWNEYFQTLRVLLWQEHKDSARWSTWFWFLTSKESWTITVKR